MADLFCGAGGTSTGGNGSEITKQIGNAVPRRLARALVAAAVGQTADVRAMMEAAA